MSTSQNHTKSKKGKKRRRRVKSSDDEEYIIPANYLDNGDQTPPTKKKKNEKAKTKVLTYIFDEIEEFNSDFEGLEKELLEIGPLMKELLL